jgi:hypothetical protein
MAEQRRKDESQASERRGARGYSWPPFEKGNLVAVKHGASSERIVSARAAEIRVLLVESFPFLAEPIFAEALERYVRAEARARLLYDYCFAKAEAEGVEAVPRTLWQEASRAESNAAKCAQDLGLDPAGFARIGRDLGVARSIGQRLAGPGLAEFAADGRKLRQLRGRGA